MPSKVSPEVPPAIDEAVDEAIDADEGSAVGFFWVTSRGVYLGGPLIWSSASEVLLTSEGVRISGSRGELPGPHGESPEPREEFWATWEDVRAVTVTGAKVVSMARRVLSKVVEIGLAAIEVLAIDPLSMTVTVETSTETVEVTVHCAVDIGYTERDADLSHRLLERCGTGDFPAEEIRQWLLALPLDRAKLSAPERERLLRQWAGGAE
ncbi:hypothetical protein ACIOWG_26115 [Streptomyces sp. NPDC087658]|uniref:hypothetical protein n=1 Tax=Streptomyces sp. NPDC087658 TaxID=3365800 RepID=UPI0038001DEA